MPAHHNITSDNIAEVRQEMDCCPTCSRTDNPVWDVTTSYELVSTFNLSETLPRQSVNLGYLDAVHAGRAWLFRWAEAQARWGGGELPAFQYWMAPDVPCPTCHRAGDPLYQVVTLANAPGLPGQSKSKKRYALTTASEITHRRQAGRTLLFHKEQVASWVEKNTK